MTWWARMGGVVLGLAVLLAPVGAGAAGPQLNLQQLISMALQYSPDVKATKSDVKLAQEEKNEAHGYRFPQLDTTAVGGLVPNVHNLPEVRHVPGTLYFSDSKTRVHGVNVFGHLDFSVVQPLYTFGKIAFRERAAERNVKVKEAAVDAKKGEVIFQVSQAYYGLILAEQGKDAVKEARSYLGDTRERLNRLLAVRSTSVREEDRYRLAAYEGAVEKFAAEADEGAKVAYTALKALTGQGPGQDFSVPPELPNPTPPAALDTYVRTALELRPEFTQLKEGLAARQLLVDAAKADRYPSFFLAVVGQLAGAPGRKYNADPYVLDYFNDNYAMPVLGAKWHYDFGILKAKVGQAQAELEKLQETQRTALMGIPVEVAQAHGKAAENYKASAGLEKAYVNARRWLITSFSSFDMGLGKMEDIFQAFERYGSFRGDYLMALYQYNLAMAQLEKATGVYRRTLASAEAPVPAAAKGK
jgi:outer membrane protein TolC